MSFKISFYFREKYLLPSLSYSVYLDEHLHNFELNNTINK